MYQKIKLIFICIMSLQVLGCAQSHEIISGATATYKIQMPGNVAVDPSGRDVTPRQVERKIYLQSAQPAIVWNSAVQNGHEFMVTTRVTNDSSIEVGKNFKTNEPVMIRIESGNQLYELTLTSDKPDTPEGIAHLNDSITVWGLFKGKKISQVVKNVIEITPEIRY